MAHMSKASIGAKCGAQAFTSGHPIVGHIFLMPSVGRVAVSGRSDMSDKFTIAVLKVFSLIGALICAYVWIVALTIR